MARDSAYMRARKFIKLMGCTCVRRFENVK